MANVRLKFFGTKRSETDENSLEVYATSNHEILIIIDDSVRANCLCLDIPTAIKLAKVLRQEINLIKQYNE